MVGTSIVVLVNLITAGVSVWLSLEGEELTPEAQQAVRLEVRLDEAFQMVVAATEYDQTKLGLDVTLTLPMEYNASKHTTEFFRPTLAVAYEVSEERIWIHNITAGSVVLAVTILDNEPVEAVGAEGVEVDGADDEEVEVADDGADVEGSPETDRAWRRERNSELVF